MSATSMRKWSACERPPRHDALRSRHRRSDASHDGRRERSTRRVPRVDGNIALGGLADGVDE